METNDEFKQVVNSTIDKAIACGRALQRREDDSLIESYRRKDVKHERMVGQLLELLKADDLDAARDIVQTEYDAIYGPNG